MSTMNIARKTGDEDLAYDLARQREVDREDETPHLSSSIAKILLSRSPLHAWFAHPQLNPNYKPEERAEFDYGTAAHALLLEGDESKIAVIQADDWRTKAAKEARDAARTDGKTPMLERQLVKVRDMVRLAREAINASEIAEQWASGTSEQTIYWKHGTVLCRSRLDRLSDDCKWIFDYKTAENAEPEAFIRAALGMGYDVQEAFYRMAVRAEYEKEARFVFVVQEKEPPHAVSLVAFDPAMQEMAERRAERAMASWAACLASGRWPGYANRIAYAMPPAWYAARNESLDELLETGEQA